LLAIKEEDYFSANNRIGWRMIIPTLPFQSLELVFSSSISGKVDESASYQQLTAQSHYEGKRRE
jgi:hypothetical protein